MKNLGVLSTTLSPWSHWSLSLSKGVAIGSIVVMFLLAACSDDDKTAGGTEEDAGIVAIEDKTISGVSQKGPFVNGSSVTVYGLDGETLAQTGNIYEGKIKSDMGDFSVKVVKLASQYALLKANGFYRNEVTGEKSNSQMTLYALTDLSDRDEVNVNLLTHLAYERSLYLATGSMSVANAKKQAEAEVFKSFDIEGDFGVAEDLNIFGENDQSAALLAISVLMQGDLKEADFSERLDNYARDIETDGVWDDKKTATAVADWASEKSLNGGLATIRANVEKWGQLFGVPPFEKYVNNFWWQNYGLGTCGKERQGEVKVNDNALSVKNGVHFICDSNAWRLATDIEKDTYKWSNSTDGNTKKGDVTSTIYVFDKNEWRKANDVEAKFGGCIASIVDSIGEVGGGFYICNPQGWEKATTLQYDTYKQACSEFGKIIHGNINKASAYFCDGEKWKVFYGNESITYGKLVDERDSQIYRTVKIGEQVWMAENLNYKAAMGCFCRNDTTYREQKGLLYSWAAAMGKKEGECDCSTGCGNVSGKIQGVCPKGWHLPSIQEWEELFNEVGGCFTGNTVLKSSSAWQETSWQGTDVYGFSVIPTGFSSIDNPSEFIVRNEADGDLQAPFWSSTCKDNEGSAHSVDIVYSIDDLDSGVCLNRGELDSNSLVPVRCVKDEE